MSRFSKKAIVSAGLIFLSAALLALSIAIPDRTCAAAVQAAPASCQAPEYHQFDFWLGDWEVQNPSGKMVGHNLVTRELDGCLIVEHWNDAANKNLGSSFNYFDTRDKKWHQLYISNSGNAGDFPAMAGEFHDGKMQLTTDSHDGPVSRWTWYVVSPGHVRQMAEQIQPDKSWKITWDSIYVKK